MKSLKVDLYRDRSGLPMLTLVRKSKSGDPYGVIGSLFRYSRKSERTFQSVVHTFMVYSLFKNHKLSDSQKEKFVKAVNADTSKVTEQFLRAFEKHVGSLVHKKLFIGKPKPMLQFRGSGSKKAPIFRDRSIPQSEASFASLSYFVNYRPHKDLYRKYEPLYKYVCEGFDPFMEDYLFSQEDSIDSYLSGRDTETTVFGGEVHFLQEPGLKLRAIASPYLVHQVALGPLGTTLYSHMRTLPWDCTHDQSKPVKFLQQHLAQHKTVHSVDLSNATDYFPLEVQLSALRALCGNHLSIDLFAEISRSHWKSSIGNVQWKQGQPLGLYPSFASFGTTHGYLLHFLLGKRYEGEFYLVGDDVVILDTSLYHRYIEALDLLGCPYSPDKSISSSELCEFAGKVITSKRVVPSYKWRELSDDNFLDIVRNYGRKAVALLTPIQRKVVERIQHCVEPIGLNWSFKDSNLEVMTQATNEIYRKVDFVEQSLTGLQRHTQSSWFAMHSKMKRFLTGLVRVSTEVDTIQDMTRTFDEKVVATLQQVFPKEWVKSIMDNHIQGGFAGVPAAVGLTDLPLETLQPSRVTTLDRYRKLLNL